MAVPCFNKEQAYTVCNHGTTKLGTNMLLGIFIHSMWFVFLNTTVDNKFADFQHNLFAIIHVSQDANWLYQRKHLARTYLINAACIAVNVVIWYLDETETFNINIVFLALSPARQPSLFCTVDTR